MTTLKKRPIRQFSLQNSPKVPERRKSLKKQFSEDLPDDLTSTAKEIESPNSIRVSLSAKDKNREPPKPVKVAWSEISENLEKNSKKENIKNIENKPKNNNNITSIIKQKSLDKNIIFKPDKPVKVDVKQNLNIFLNSGGLKDSKDELSELSDSSYSSSVDNLNNTNLRRPKLILPLNPEITNNDNVKSVFQKHIRKVTKQKSLFIDRSFSPIRSEICSTIVVPVITNKTENLNRKEPKIHRQTSLDIDPRKSNENLLKSNSRPSSANSTKKEIPKRSPSASSLKKENFRPPLIRTSSVPVKNETNKPKFIATKRRVKTAKAKVRLGKEEANEENLSVNRRNLLKRCVSVSEVETMVSLVSPSGSENEEEVETDKNKEVEESPLKTSLVKEKLQENEQCFSLRKTVKSVSFQQSTIHAIRSFSASFPERRKSVATALFLNNSSISHLYKIQEKRAPVNTIEDEERVPKRRLIRTKSAPLHRSTEEETPPDGSQSRESISNNKTNSKKLQETSLSKETIKNEEDTSEKSSNTSSSLSETLENTKERECWDMYCKMNEKGVTISFDTILRGMLTPTEYRLRSKTTLEASTVEDNCEIAEN